MVNHTVEITIAIIIIMMIVTIIIIITINVLIAASDSEQHPNPILSRDLSVTMQRCKDDFEPQILMACGKIACCAMAFANN